MWKRKVTSLAKDDKNGTRKSETKSADQRNWGKGKGD